MADIFVSDFNSIIKMYLKIENKNKNKRVNIYAAGVVFLPKRGGLPGGGKFAVYLESTTSYIFTKKE